MISAVELVGRAVRCEVELPEAPQRGQCCVLGDERDTIARRHAILPSMTTLDVLAAPRSDRVSVEAYCALAYRWERMSSWVCGDRFERLKRAGVRDAVLADGRRDGPWSGYATTSYKKHGSLFAPVNLGDRAVWLWETTPVDCSDRARVESWWGTLRRSQDAGLPRPVLENPSGCSIGYALKTIGLAAWREFESWAAPRWREPLYQFLCYLLPSKEELKAMREEADDGEEGFRLR